MTAHFNSHHRRGHPTARLAIGLPVLTLLLALIAGCEATAPDEQEPQAYPATSMEDIEVPEDFDFALRVKRSLTVDLETPGGDPYPGIMVEVRLNDGTLMATGFTDAGGMTRLTFVLPPGDREAVVRAPAIGIVEPERRVILADAHTNLSIR